MAKKRVWTLRSFGHKASTYNIKPPEGLGDLYVNTYTGNIRGDNNFHQFDVQDKVVAYLPSSRQSNGVNPASIIFKDLFLRSGDYVRVRFNDYVTDDLINIDARFIYKKPKEEQ